eukprot:CAMPEP_0180689282 /NCGR_PEP_ID=MMETSP1037_2-20121125/74420_1 /TAXON_ID=632150 /ORGANISM="Azadinium spinosum, Strain 3D9" /LENGTH=56 /DNA_ID=CAMNT_0022720157 /DNA_START=212 /DNA_END=379 /DNA_ORIENTATION=+
MSEDILLPHCLFNTCPLSVFDYANDVMRGVGLVKEMRVVGMDWNLTTVCILEVKRN